MRVLITGGTGLVGRALCAELLGAGHDVVVVSRDPQQSRATPGTSIEEWDARSAAQLSPLVEGADAVVHLLGESIAAGRWNESRKREIEDSRVRSTVAVAEAIGWASAKPSVLLQGSAVGYYGGDAAGEVDESSPTGEDFLAMVCRRWEAASAGVTGVRRVLLRTGVVLSLDGGAFPKIVKPIKLGVGGKLGSGGQPFPWIHLADEVGAIRFLLEHDSARGPFNLTAPGVLTNAEFTKVVGRVARRPTLFPAPAIALKVLLGEMSTLLLEGQRAVPRALQAAGYTFRFPDAESAVRDLLGRRS